MMLKYRLAINPRLLPSGMSSDFGTIKFFVPNIVQNKIVANETSLIWTSKRFLSTK
jgi:hypothetical protein